MINYFLKNHSHVIILKFNDLFKLFILFKFLKDFIRHGKSDFHFIFFHFNFFHSRFFY
jgi:hypothetical protein